MKLDNGTRNFIKTTIIGGLIVILPMAIFYIVTTFIFYTVTGVVKPLLGLSNAHEVFEYPLLVDFFALVFLILLCFLIGLFVSTPHGKKLVDRVERHILFKLPYYGTIKEAVQQLIGNSNMNLFKVVLIDLYNTDTLTTGFLTDETLGEYCTVFVPTGPNPTSGFIYHVKRSQIIVIDVKPEEAMRSIIAVGSGSSNILNKHFLYESGHSQKTESTTPDNSTAKSEVRE
ncbi:DUF502 domain-containing protein [Membranihabitans maritimus]|uniref:DUF502 domain-containing protein n=1 Tax=Membranihabitans maritimus TaxID=2904244 RepID=UPI001F33FEBC|nr:DUF502 domain-containing protein [Membranihabitans maritimus]